MTPALIVLACFLLLGLGGFLGAVVVVCTAGDAIVALLKPVLPNTGKE